jgi:hypothetical protein
MDKFKELTTGAKLVLGAAVVLLLVSWLNWFEYESWGQNMWHGIGFLAGLLLIGLIVWQALRLANINLEVGVTPSMITAALAVLTLLFVIIRFIDKPGGDFASDLIDRTIWAWLGLALAIILVVGAWMNMQAAGEGFAEIRSSVAGAAAAAKGAVDRGDDASAAAPTPPAPEAPAPAAPEAPAAPPAEAPPAPEPGDDAPRAS